MKDYLENQTLLYEDNNYYLVTDFNGFAPTCRLRNKDCIKVHPTLEALKQLSLIKAQDRAAHISCGTNYPGVAVVLGGSTLYRVYKDAEALAKAIEDSI